MYEAKEAEQTQARIEALVETAIADGKIDREAKAQWVEMATGNYTLAESTLASIPAREQISAQIASDPANVQAAANAAKTAEQLMAEKVTAVVGEKLSSNRSANPAKQHTTTWQIRQSIFCRTATRAKSSKTFSLIPPQGNDTFKEGLIHIKSGIQHQYTLPAIKIGNVIQDNVPTPTSNNGG